jgi:hypothetical protein
MFVVGAGIAVVISLERHQGDLAAVVVRRMQQAARIDPSLSVDVRYTTIGVTVN